MHEAYEVKVVRVIDGDTFVGDVRHHILGIEIVIKNQYFRLNGIDTPEMRGDERAQGIEVTAYVKDKILGKKIGVYVNGKDKYGRWLTEVFVEGINLNRKLLEIGFAEPYE